MSIIPPGLEQSIPFYLSGPLPCPYLPDQVERKLFTRLDEDGAVTGAVLNSTLCRAGFRRSHEVVYRPACNKCNACKPVRIPVAEFMPSRSLRKVAVRNADLFWSHCDAVATDEMFALFSAYQAARHGDSEMAQMTADDFSAMVSDGNADTHLYLLRAASGELMGGLLADHVGDGVSAVYSFFKPEEARRSLGSALVLFLVDEARLRGWPYVYLGYWVEQSRKMAYKSRFKPLQFLSANGWELLPK